MTQPSGSQPSDTPPPGTHPSGPPAGTGRPQPFQRSSSGGSGGAGAGADLARALLVAVAVLGIANLFLGFAPALTSRRDSVSFYDGFGGVAWVPALLFLGGLFAARAAVLPGRRDVSSPALVTAAAMVPYYFALMKTDYYGFGAGAVLIAIFGSIQLVLAAVAAGLAAGRLRYGSEGAAVAGPAAPPMPPPPATPAADPIPAPDPLTPPPSPPQSSSSSAPPSPPAPPAPPTTPPPPPTP